MSKIVIAGRLGRDPEPIGQNGCRFSLAENGYDFKAKEKTTFWYNCSAFGKTSEILLQYVRKGHLILFHGRCEPHKYTDKDGVEVNTYNFTADSIEMLGKGDDKGNQPKTSESNQYKQLDSKLNESPSFEDDDIPF